MTVRSVAMAKGPVCAVLVAALFVATSCSKTPEPSPSSPPAEPAKAQTPAGAAPEKASTAASPTGPSEVAWTAPSTWQKVDNPSPMRKATYRIERAAGDTEDAELSVTQAGGTVEMNINRWAGQFDQKPAGEVKRSERTVAGIKVTVVEIQGTFRGSGMPGAPAAPPKPGAALLGAIIETQPASTFFKLTGPEKTVTLAKADFDKLIESITPK